GQSLVNSAFTLALVAGQSVTDISQNVFANLGWTDITLPNPVFAGDTIHSRTEVLSLRESSSRPGLGIATVRTTGNKQTGETAIAYVLTANEHTGRHRARTTAVEAQ